MDVQVRNLCASYRTQGKTKHSMREILHDVSFTSVSGRRLCVMGANGSGKTTLIRALIGAIPYTGSVMFGNRELRSLKRIETGQRVAVLTQLNPSYFSYSVEETILQGRYARSISVLHGVSEEDRRVVNEVMSVTGLTDIKDEQIGRLSGGQLQRVFLARTLAQQTPVIILDEPTNHLDLKYQEELLRFLLQWSTQTTKMPDGMETPNTVIGVFHDIHLAMGFAEDVCLLRNGGVLAFGERDKVLTDEYLRLAFDVDVRAVLENQASRWHNK